MVTLVRLLRVPIEPMVVVASLPKEPLRTVFALDDVRLVVRMGFFEVRYQFALQEERFVAHWAGEESRSARFYGGTIRGLSLGRWFYAHVHS